MKEKIIRVGLFSVARNRYEAITTNRDGYQATEDNNIWRRCSDNSRGRIVTHQDGLEFTPES